MSSRSRTHLLSRIALAVILAATLPARAADAWDDMARDVLLPALREAQPDVTAWDLQALLGKRQLEKLHDLAPATARVLRLGARSAVSLRSPQRSGDLTVWYAVRGEREVIVARRDFAPGSALSPADATTVIRDVMAVGCEALADAAALEQMRARAAVRADHVVCAEHIEPRPAVGRGEPVTVHSIVGRVRVTATAIAERDGAIGELLNVRAPASGAAYVVRVTGRQEARIDE